LIDIFDVTDVYSELAKYELNGRQIRNTIRLAQALAKNEKTALSMSHVERTISVASQFKEDVAIGDDESGAGVDSKVLVATAVLPVVSLSALCAVAYFIKRKFF
jgi:DNA replicative helicase MCM subunit Mcm2 (Cdc46/Mcm family)